MKIVSSVLAFAVLLSVPGVLLAQGGLGGPAPAAADKKKGQEDKAKNQEWTYPLTFLNQVEDLTANQKAKLKKLLKECNKKKFDGTKVLTPEQKEAFDKAAKEAKDAGKTPPWVIKAAWAAVTLTDEQKAKQMELMKVEAKANKECWRKALTILTDEQKKLKKPAQSGK